MTSEPRYRRIADAIRARVTSGELRPGDRAPSTREITRAWGVAMATATKALTTLRHEGVLVPAPGIGMIVRPRPAAAGTHAPAGVHPVPRTGARSGPPAAPRPVPSAGVRSEPGARGRGEDGGLTRDRVVRAGIAIADAQGLDGLSMRRVAAELGVGVMSLYRHVQDREELVRNMAGDVFAGRPLPEPPPAGWRACLELAARTQWELYGRHPWLAAVVSFTRPPLVPAMMAHTAWTVRALRGHGLSPADLTREAITLPAFVRGVAISRTEEAAAARATGQSLEAWWASRAETMIETLGTAALSDLVHLDQEPSADFEALFEYGLARHLDGLSVLLRRSR